jgi:membrane protease YdiL (CAAX protease family)
MMLSEIGRGLRGTRRIVALGVSALAVVIDFWLVWLNRYPESIEGRWAIALAALLAHLWLARGDLPTVGLASPAGGWLRWARIAAYLGLIVAACLATAAVIWKIMGHTLPSSPIAPEDIGPAFFRMCVFSPMLEELVYRAVLCMGTAAALGTGWAIVVSGLSFAFLHVVYGSPSPENLLGGFLLAWAYLRSGSLFVPLALHAAGNLLIMLWQIGLWYSLVNPA